MKFHALPHSHPEEIGINFTPTQWALPLHFEWHDDRDYFIAQLRVLCWSFIFVRWRA